MLHLTAYALQPPALYAAFHPIAVHNNLPLTFWASGPRPEHEMIWLPAHVPPAIKAALASTWSPSRTLKNIDLPLCAFSP